MSAHLFDPVARDPSSEHTVREQHAGGKHEHRHHRAHRGCKEQGIDSRERIARWCATGAAIGKETSATGAGGCRGLALRSMTRLVHDDDRAGDRHRHQSLFSLRRWKPAVPRGGELCGV
jgi:hypothetical protein